MITTTLIAPPIAPSTPAREPFDVTRRYRTIHSINDDDVGMVISNIPRNATTVLDYGCHLGHLAFEIAIQRNVLVFAVDNFTGTAGDPLMAQTVQRMTDGRGDFLPNFIDNMEDAAARGGGFRGRVIPMRTAEFDRFLSVSDVRFDLAFIDGSHRADEAQMFPTIAARIPIGGVLAGHDYDTSNPDCAGVVGGIELIKHDFEWVQQAYTWCMRKHDR